MGTVDTALYYCCVDRRGDDGDLGSVGREEAAEVCHGDHVADGSCPWEEHEVSRLGGALHFSLAQAKTGEWMADGCLQKG